MHLKRSSQDFEGTISGLGSTQLLTSWAITIAGTQAYPDSFEDPHAILAALLSLLASTTQAVPLWSGVLREKPWIQKFRQSLHGIHMIVFLGSFIGRSGAKTAESTPPVVVWSVTTITVLSVFWNLGLTLVVVFRRTKKRAMKRSDKTTAAVIGYLALVPTLYLISLVFYMKFGSKACPLNSSEDNAWSYGQFLAILMAAAPFVAAVEDFISELDTTFPLLKVNTDSNLRLKGCKPGLQS